ncbi:DUF943 family protein [Erwinia papayae]|uniref:DUF943 family protein n=1 Tax=Erwinia papayae TaxID=206499 RepID=A0ABV3MZT2_9GAMM
MKRILFGCLFVVLIAIGTFFWLNNRSVTVIDGHYVRGSAQVIVDRLPLLDSSRIKWWEDNQKAIRAKYHIPQKGKDPMLIVIYAFGEGYQEEGKKDRRCFEDMAPPRNCIDKNILMMIWRTRDGGVEYDF